MCVGAFLRQKTPVFLVLLFVVFFAFVVTEAFATGAPIMVDSSWDEGDVGQGKIQADIAELPLSFIANAGQADANVRFMVKVGKQTIFFTPQEVVFAASEETEGEDTRSSVVSPGNEFLVGDTGNE